MTSCFHAIKIFDSSIFAEVVCCYCCGFFFCIFFVLFCFLSFLRNLKFILVTFTFLHCFDSYILVVNLNQFLTIFSGFGEIKESKMAAVTTKWLDCK